MKRPLSSPDEDSGFDRRLFMQSGLAAGTMVLSSGAVLSEATPQSSTRAALAVSEIGDAILWISREVWAIAEPSLAEVASMKVHLRELEAEGFTIVSTGTSGVPTAFVAEWTQGSGGPVVGYLPEYDALPSNFEEPLAIGTRVHFLTLVRSDADRIEIRDGVVASEMTLPVVEVVR